MEMLSAKGKILQVFLLILALGLTTIACIYVPPTRRQVVYVDEERHDGNRHLYYYYPSANVYFDPGTRYYYWLEGSNWRKSRTLPRDVVVVRKKRIEFESDAREPYIVHEKVRSIGDDGRTIYERREYRRGEAPPTYEPDKSLDRDLDRMRDTTPDTSSGQNSRYYENIREEHHETTTRGY